MTRHLRRERIVAQRATYCAWRRPQCSCEGGVGAYATCGDLLEEGVDAFLVYCDLSCGRLHCGVCFGRLIS